MITQQEIHGNWNRLKGAIQEKWGQLTDDDVMRVKGNADQLVGMIQKKTGESRVRVEAFFDEALKDTASTVERATEKIRDYASDIADSAQDRYQDASQAVHDGLATAQNTVKRHPTESVAVCFGAGLIAGAVLGLMMRNRA